MNLEERVGTRRTLFISLEQKKTNAEENAEEAKPTGAGSQDPSTMLQPATDGRVVVSRSHRLPARPPIHLYVSHAIATGSKSREPQAGVHSACEVSRRSEPSKQRGVGRASANIRCPKPMPTLSAALHSPIW